MINYVVVIKASLFYGKAWLGTFGHFKWSTLKQKKVQENRIKLVIGKNKKVEFE